MSEHSPSQTLRVPFSMDWQDWFGTEVDITSTRPGATADSIIAIATIGDRTLEFSITSETECACGDDCPLVATDCCDILRFECETGVGYDANGDPDVRGCLDDFGCALTRTVHM